jgi:DNA polymerase-3 subunit gamma/tau
MSYLVLARKWRPTTFDDVVGQEHVTGTIKKAIEKNRVAHAFVFTGTRGVGKTTVARILARALNCEKGPTPEPCGECESCKSILGGSNFDVREIDGASNNSVEDIRDLRDNINYSSMGGKYRIYVIDEVHMLSKAAFNALLKTLEEPPKNVIFIFATTEPRKIPDTILSRCQRFDFRRISAERILGQLEKICTSMNITFERQALMLLARKADGSMRDALSLLDQVYSFSREKIDEKEVRSVLGLVEHEIYSSLMNAVSEKKPDRTIASVEDVLLKGYDLDEFLTGLEEHVRNLLFAKIPGALDAENRNPGPEVLKKLGEQSARFSEGDLLRMTEILHRTQSDLRWSSYPRFLVEIALIKMSYMDSTVSIENLLSSIKDRPASAVAQQTAMPQQTMLKKNSEPELTSAPAIGQQSAEVGGSQIPALVIQPSSEVISRPVGDTTESFDAPEKTTLAKPVDPAVVWHDFINLLMKDRPNLGSFLSMAYVAASTESSIDVRFPPQCSFQFSEASKKSNREQLTEKLNTICQRQMELHISLETHKQEAKPAVSPAAQVTPALGDDMEQEPIIKTVMEAFDAEPV